MLRPLYNHEAVKLGRRKKPKDAPAPLALKAFATAPRGAAPLAVDWLTGVVGWGMFLNDTLGDCTIAACANAMVLWTWWIDRKAWVVSDDAVKARYALASGWNGTPATDNGAYEGVVLGLWSQNGWDIGRQVPSSILWAAVDPMNRDEVCNAIHLFGALYIALDLPISAQKQGVWDIVVGVDPTKTAPNSWGPHAVIVVAYDEDGLTCITWGVPQKMSWQFFIAYCVQAYALFSRDWLDVHSAAPNHYDFDALAEALVDLPPLVTAA